MRIVVEVPSEAHVRQLVALLELIESYGFTHRMEALAAQAVANPTPAARAPLARSAEALAGPGGILPEPRPGEAPPLGSAQSGRPCRFPGCTEMAGPRSKHGLCPEHSDRYNGNRMYAQKIGKTLSVEEWVRKRMAKLNPSVAP